MCPVGSPGSNVYVAILLRLQTLSFYLINFENSVCAPKEVYMDYYRLIRETAAYFIDFMDKHETSNLRFHNVTHTHEVVEAARQMGRYYKLDERDMTIVTIASYFHDTGYCGNGRENAFQNSRVW